MIFPPHESFSQSERARPVLSVLVGDSASSPSLSSLPFRPFHSFSDQKTFRDSFLLDSFFAVAAAVVVVFGFRILSCNQDRSMDGRLDGRMLNARAVVAVAVRRTAKSPWSSLA